MPICALCNQNEADKTGSHLVPFFLMRTVDNVDNKKERGMELGFELGKGYVKSYFGESVLPERLEPVLGRIKDEDINASQSSMIVDHLLCTSCETRLGKLESFYAATMNTTSKALYKSSNDCFRALLFWISIFWRLSISENKNYHLIDSDELRLRTILDTGMNTTNHYDYINNHGKDISGVGYRILRQIGYASENSGWFFINNDNNKPYCLMVGEFAVFLYMDNIDTNKISQPFLGLETESLKCKLSNCSDGEYILPINLEIFTEACRQAVDFWKDIFLQNIDEKCEKLHRHFIGSGSMNPEIKNQIINEISAEGKLLGRQYSIEGIVDSISKTLIKFEPYRSIAEHL
jgi:hypothetical protein